MRPLFSVALIAAALPPAARADAPATFTKDVAPILFKHCASCHRPGEVAPFPLLSFPDAAKRAKHLVEVVTERRMPPWLPEPGRHKFLDERRLSDAEIATLERWAESGAKEGDPKDLPAPPKFTDGWQLGPPDVVVKMPKPFIVPADGPDVYQGFVVPVPTDKTRYLNGFEFRPGNRKLVHHAIVLMDTSGKLREVAEKENGPGFRLKDARGELLPLKVTGASIGEWNPGRTPRLLPDGISRPFKPGTDLILLVHYHPSGKPEPDQSTVGLFFTDKPGGKFLAHFPVRVGPDVGNTDLLKIPAGTKDHKVAVSRVLPGDGSIYTLTPHSHYLLKEFKLTATPPGGETATLLEVKRWDFNQQERYVFAEPPKFPKGTRIDLVGRFDNSADNPLNPSNPPKSVRWGESTTDEMFGVAIRLLPEGDESVKAFRALSVPKSKTSVRAILPPGGFPIPAEAKFLREKCDTNGDGKLSAEEIEAIPPPVRQKVEDYVREHLGKDAQGPMADAAFRLPPDGFPLPPEAKVLREQYDTDKDGKLSQKEFEAIPQPMRARVEELIRKRQAAGAKDRSPELLPVPPRETPATRVGRE
jgi:mono/diheme cytochrome c family protein